MTTTTRQPQAYTADRIMDAVKTLIDRGETDNLDGGIASQTLADYLEIDPSDARQHLRTYARERHLEQVNGVNPATLRPRKSYLPAGDGDE